MKIREKLEDIASENYKLDEYLISISKKFNDHRFLGAATQGVYLRQISLLKRLCEANKSQMKNINVLDWGAGKGHISYLLSKQGFKVTSCDLNQNANDSTFGQKTPIIDDKGINVEPLDHPWILPFDDGSFDIVVSFGVLEHVQNHHESILEIRRILRKGGLFYFCFLPYYLSWTQKIAHIRGNFYHDRLYSKKAVIELAQFADFKVEDIWHGQLFPKNSIGHSDFLERLDRFICTKTPLRFFATNLEGVMIAT